MTIRFPALAGLAAVISLAGCGGDSAGPTAAAPLTAVARCAPAVTLDLQHRQTASLTAANAACFALSPHAGARYGRAGFGPRPIDAGRRRPEPAMSGHAAVQVGRGSGTP